MKTLFLTQEEYLAQIDSGAYQLLVDPIDDMSLLEPDDVELLQQQIEELRESKTIGAYIASSITVKELKAQMQSESDNALAALKDKLINAEDTEAVAVAYWYAKILKGRSLMELYNGEEDQTAPQTPPQKEIHDAEIIEETTQPTTQASPNYDMSLIEETLSDVCNAVNNISETVGYIKEAQDKRGDTQDISALFEIINNKVDDILRAQEQPPTPPITPTPPTPSAYVATQDEADDVYNEINTIVLNILSPLTSVMPVEDLQTIANQLLERVAIITDSLATEEPYKYVVSKMKEGSLDE